MLGAFAPAELVGSASLALLPAHSARGLEEEKRVIPFFSAAPLYPPEEAYGET